MIITDDTFDSVLKENHLILVDFWAPWCNPCEKVGPILDEISSEYGLLVGKLNIDENPIKTSYYGVSTIPSMIIFKSGVPEQTIVGAKPKHVMIQELSKWI
jgi:thioredoxin 1